jgi:hypothetical protein
VLRPPPHSLKTFLKTPIRTSSWSTLIRQSLGLTQTCQQLRSEFLPIHSAYTKIVVHVAGIERYVSDFGSHEENATDTLLVDMRSLENTDLLPLLQLRTQSPRVSYVSNSVFGPQALDFMQSVLDLCINRRWLTYAASSISLFEVRFRPSPWLYIQVKLGAKEDWMPYLDPRPEDHHRYRAALGWKKEVGLEESLSMWQIGVGVADK